MTSLPEHLIVVGSGVTGAEFASAYMNLGAKVTLVSSRDQVLPGEDKDAATVLEKVFKRGGMTVLSKSRADKVERQGDGVLVTLADGRTVEGSHCLMAVGSIPNTAGIGLEEAGVQMTESGHIQVNRVARTSVPNIYAAGDCTTFVPLASVASMQGRTAVFHALGDVVIPLERRRITSNIFTAPEIATIGWQEQRHHRRPHRRRRAQAAARGQPAREDDGHQGRLRQDPRPPGQRHGDRRRDRRPRARPSSSTRSRSPSSAGSPSTSSRGCSRCTRR